MAVRRPARPTTAKRTSSLTATTTAIPAATTFAELGVPGKLTDLLAADGITAPFPIQAATLPDSLAGRDVLGRGRTGSGKTLGFLLPVLTRLAGNPRKRRPNHPRALILAPTRELATQIHSAAEPLANALGLRTTAIFGGVGQRPQISALRSGLDLVVACPGRLLDHVDTGHANLGAIEITVLDEADHMADLGFLPMVKRILDATPADGQRLLFSATLDNGIDTLARRYLHNPVTHSVDTPHSEVPTMTHHVLHIEAADRLPILVELTSAPGRTIVFTRTKHGARKLAKQLLAARIPAVDLHGNLAQSARTRNLAAFASGQATTLVVHADPPAEHKAYLHRSGRTARAGNSGTVVTLMTDAQVSEVRELTRKAKITADTTRVAPGNPLFGTLAPGERSLAEPEQIAALTGGGEGRGTGDAASTTGSAPSGSASGARGGGGGGRARRRGPRRSGSEAGQGRQESQEPAKSRQATGKSGGGAGVGAKAAGNGAGRVGGAAKAGANGAGRAGGSGGRNAGGAGGSGSNARKRTAASGTPSTGASGTARTSGAPATSATSANKSGGAARVSQNFRGRGR